MTTKSKVSKRIARSIVVLGAFFMLVAAHQARGLEFGIPTPMPMPFDAVGANGYPWLTQDGLDIYFATDRSDPSSLSAVGIWTAHRDSLTDDWGSAVDLGAPVNTTGTAEFGASLTADGQQMYFMRAVSPFGLANGDLFLTDRQPDNSWGVPQPLARLNTSDGIEAYPTISPDGKTLYFNTVANPNYPSSSGLPYNTWVARRDSTADPFENPEFFFDGYGTVTPDGLTHILFGYPNFADYYDVPNVGNGDLYIRTRDSIDDDFGSLQFLEPPVNGSGQFLEPPLTGAGLECCASISASDSTFYFTSIRPETDHSGVIGFVDLWQAPIAESIPLDIKPGSDTTPINLKSKGKLPVAILSTDEFDATQVDAETLLFGDPLLIADGKTPVSPIRWGFEDVNDDDLLDLTLKFSMRDILGNDVMDPMTTQGYLAGQTFDGMEIAGREMVTIVGSHLVPEPASGLLLLLGGFGLATYRKR
jgi:hypothetical protein